MASLKIIAVFALVLVAGLAGAAADDAKVDLSVVEGGNLTVFTVTTVSEDDPQIMLTLMNGTSDKLIAQLFCHDQKCEQNRSDPAVVIHYDTRDVTISFLNARCNQTGLYKVFVFSRTHSEIKMINVTVFESTLRTGSPESSSSSMIGILVTAAVFVSIFIGVIIYVIYQKHKKGRFARVPTVVLISHQSCTNG